jgi:Tol biopolymer transport system component
VLSPDGKRVAVIKGDLDKETQDLWVLDAATGQGIQITNTQPREPASTPVWSPDGSQVAYVRLSEGFPALYRKASTGAGAEELLYRHTAPMDLTDWSADGRYLLLHGMLTSLARIALASVDLQQSDRTPVKYVENAGSVAHGQFSPDGKFVAYASNVSDRSEIYLQRFPATSDRWQLSVDGGAQPRWRRDGRELYFVGADGTMMAVPIALDRPNPGGTPVRLFASGIVPENFFYYGGAAQYAVSKDGQKFIVIRSVKAGDPGSIRIVLNAIR